MVAIETIKKKRGRRKLKLLAVVLLVFSTFLLSSCTEKQIEDGVDIAFDILQDVLDDAVSQDEQGSQNSSNTNVPTSVDGEMVVHFIDVGQADATLFIQGDQVMLFDVGLKNRGDDLVEYIKNLGIDYIDVVVLTHPHNDHMGGAAEVFNNIEVGKVYGPDIFNISSLDTLGWYNDMLDAIDAIDQKNNANIPEDKQTSVWHFPRNEKGEFAKFNIGDAVVEFYAPLEDEYSDMNDYSICAKVSYGTVDILLTGDATTSVEDSLLSEGYDLDVEIFQAGHHGSDTSNSKEFLEAMSPECIVISCGMKNQHKHPVKSVIELFEEMNIPVYRTDESGDIILTTDGTDYSFNTDPGTYTSGEEYREKGD